MAKRLETVGLKGIGEKELERMYDAEFSTNLASA